MQHLEEALVAAETRVNSLITAEKYDDALKASIEAVENCIKARKQAPRPADKQRLRKKFEELMAKAESIKKLQNSNSDGVDLDNPQPPPEGFRGRVEVSRTPPISLAKLTVKEETILLKSSRVNNHVFPPWKGPPSIADFSPGTAPFSDPSGLLKLSESQRSMLDSWKRPGELYAGSGTITPEEGAVFDLAQDVITDCSVIASLCSAITREERSLGKIVSNIIYPQDTHGNPKISPSGKYIVKLHFNGCFRKVIIDDQLPASNNSRALYVTCRKNPGVFYPALIEKAYLKLMGGYDFPGSNSGTDLLALTGWIPEHVFLQSDDVVPGSLWRRIYRAWDRGDVLITLGTGKMSSREEKELGLAGEHDYAVLGLKEEDGERILQVKNPWSEGTVFKGLSALDSDEEEGDDEDDEDDDDEDDDDDDDDDEDDDEDNEDDEDEENEENEDWNGKHDGSTFKTKGVRESLPSPAEQLDPSAPGVFWISLDNVFRHFASIYLNWNPALFTHRHDWHFSWDLSTKKSEGCIGGNPQFSLTNPGSQPALVWLLLARHISSTVSDENTDSLDKAGYISLYVFENSGRRVYRPGGALHRGPYVDSPQTLLRLDAVPPKTTYTIAVSSQDLPKTPQAFTLTAFSLTPLRIRNAEDPYAYHLALRSQWLPETAGGNAQSPTYSSNPQFRLSISSASDIMFLLEARDSLSVHVKLVWGGGKRIASVTTRDIIAESGEYRRGCAIAETTGLQKGDYTVVASTFEPGQIGDFTLSVETTAADAVFEPIASESAGKLRKTVEGVWKSGTNTVAYPLETERLTVVSVKARTTWANSRAQPMLRVSVEKKIGRRRNIVRASSTEGEFSDVPQGVRTGDMDLEGGWDYLVVLERMGDGGGDDASQYELEILSDGIVQVGDSIWEED